MFKADINTNVTKSGAKRIIDSFLRNGYTSHSGNATMLGVVVNYCEENGIPYVLKALPNMGYYIESLYKENTHVESKKAVNLTPKITEFRKRGEIMLSENSRILNERIKKYGLENCLDPEKSLQEMTAEELQDFASAVNDADYNRDVSSTISYRDEKELVDVLNNKYSRRSALLENLNNEFSRRLSEKGLLEIFNWLGEQYNGEKWYEDIRYAILCRTERPYTETTILLRALKIKTFMTKYNVPLAEVIALFSVREISYLGLKDTTNPSDIKKESDLMTFLNTL